MTEGKFIDGIGSFDDLPEYEQLAMLSRAQSELNYVVQWSFNRAGVNMTDSLTASKKWCKFDDEFREIMATGCPHIRTDLLGHKNLSSQSGIAAAPPTIGRNR